MELDLSDANDPGRHGDGVRRGLEFLGIGPFGNDGPLDALYVFGASDTQADSEVETGIIEDEIDDIFDDERIDDARQEMRSR